MYYALSCSPPTRHVRLPLVIAKDKEPQITKKQICRRNPWRKMKRNQRKAMMDHSSWETRLGPEKANILFSDIKSAKAKGTLMPNKPTWAKGRRKERQDKMKAQQQPNNKQTCPPTRPLERRRWNDPASQTQGVQWELKKQFLRKMMSERQSWATWRHDI